MAQIAANLSDYLSGYSALVAKVEFWPTVLCSGFCLVTLASSLATSKRNTKTSKTPKTLIDDEGEGEGEWTFGEAKEGKNLLGSLVGRSTWFISKDAAPTEVRKFEFNREVNPNSADLPYRTAKTTKTYALPKVEGGEGAEAAAAALFGNYNSTSSMYISRK